MRILSGGHRIWLWVALSVAQGCASGNLDRPTASPRIEQREPHRILEEEVVVRNGNLTLAGTLVLPRKDGRCPAVVLLSGEGAEGRDGSTSRPYVRGLAHLLGAAGIASLRMDDRGVGGSGGSYEDTPIGELAGDALAGLELLRAHASVDQARTGILGFSEGAAVALLAASTSDRVRFVIQLSGPGMSGRELALAWLETLAREEPALRRELPSWKEGRAAEIEAAVSGDPKDDLSVVDGNLRLRYGKGAQDLPAATTRHLASIASLRRARARSVLSFDPCDALRRVRVPVLAINGQADIMIPPERSAERFREALKDAENHWSQVILWPDLGHSLRSEGGRQGAAETFSPRVVKFVIDWIDRP